jgi:DNA modification methylase
MENGEIGLEATPEEFVATMVAVFREVRRILKPDGCVFLNFGDSYSSATYVKVKEDVDIIEIALGIRQHMPELWQRCWKTTGEGSLSELLSETVEGGTFGACSSASTEPLSQEPESSSRENQKALASAETRRHSSDGWLLRLLRRDGIPIPLSRSHKGRRAKRPCATRGNTGGLEAGNSGRSTERPLSDSLLELQLGFRLVRFLSSLELDESSVPVKLRHFFQPTVKPKDLIGMPWRVAFALQADGWWLRSDIIWAKPNPMPESVTDRPTRSHEYLFLLTKSASYYYDADAIRERYSETSLARYNSAFGNGPAAKATKNPVVSMGEYRSEPNPAGRNKRDVWTINSEPTPEAHFATFPSKLVEPCVLAGSRIGDLVYDPFLGSGTVGKVCEALGRRWVGTELSEEYIRIAKRRTRQMGLFNFGGNNGTALKPQCGGD